MIALLLAAQVLVDGAYHVRWAAPFDEAEAREIARLLRRAEERVARSLGPTAEEALPVVLHASARSLAQTTGQPRRAGAVLWRGELHVQARALAARGDLERTLTHELAHRAVRALSAERCPRWLEEGAAIVVAGELSLLGGGRAALSPAEVSRRVAAGVDDEAYRAAGVYASRVARRPGGLRAALERLRDGALTAQMLESEARKDPTP